MKDGFKTAGALTVLAFAAALLTVALGLTTWMWLTIVLGLVLAFIIAAVNS